MSEVDDVERLEATSGDDARIAQAAADLGVEVPSGFFLTEVDDVGRHTAFMFGNTSAMKIGVAILRRLDGYSVADSLTLSAEEPEMQPDWLPPEDPNDTEAWTAWMAERARHPEWPAIFNGPTDWIALVAASGTTLAALTASAASVMKQRDRIRFAKWLVKRMEARGLSVDAVAMMRAFERGAPESPGEPSTEPASTGLSGRSLQSASDDPSVLP